ncbi:MAG TPA: hypothetical protein VI072_26255 [Polyangiaceae bacterium]
MRNAARIPAVLSLLVLSAACGGKFDPPGTGGTGGNGATGGEDGGVSGGGGSTSSDAGTCQPLRGCTSSERCNDGCNTCTCAGGQWACTRRACVDAGESCSGALDPNKRYVSRDPKECQLIDYACPPDSIGFSDECGCGCVKVPTCNITTCFRAIECVNSCGGPVIQSGCCACPPPSFDNIVCRQDSGTCGCTSTALSWGHNGGLVAWQDASALTPCRTYRRTRTQYRSDLPDVSCTTELPCTDGGAGPEHIQRLLAHADVQAALKAAPVLYGRDMRPVDGTVFRIDVGGRIIDIGTACSSAGGCRAIPAGVEALRRALESIDALGLRQRECSSLFAP